MGLLKVNTQIEQADILGRYLPNDKLWVGKYLDGNPLRKILLGLATVWLNERELINLLFDEWLPSTTNLFLEEWEKSVGIPDDCFDIAATEEERRQNILLKLTGVNATTAKQFEAIADILGFTITIRSGYSESLLPQVLPFILISSEDAPYVIIVDVADEDKPPTIPQIIPFILSSGRIVILQCLFDKLKPANTKVIFKYSN